MNTLRHLDIDDLILLVLLADGLSVTDTANKLNLTQPAISLRLKKIHSALGYPVHTKGIKRINLTPDGMRLAGVFKEALALLIGAIPN